MGKNGRNINKIDNEEVLNEIEAEMYHTYKNLVRQEYRNEIKERIIKYNASKNLQMCRYNLFKELAKLMLSYKT